ncbi:unnamed protein product, partial [Laminaria digitata]
KDVALTRGVGPMFPYMSPKGLLSFLVPAWLFVTSRHCQCSAFLTSSHAFLTSSTLLARHHHRRATSPRTTGTPAAAAWASRAVVADKWAGRSERDLSSTALVTSGRRGSRRLLMAGASSGVSSTSGGASQAGSSGARSINWPLWYVLPIAPYQRRKTLMEEIVPGKVWTFDQVQGILYVIVPVRMTVIKLENTPGGGLFVYAPVAPTGECMAMLRQLEAEHGPVKHIVLGTLGLEHKVFAGPFAQKFSQAKVWFTPGQYSFPIGLPLSWLGFGGRPTEEIPASSEDAPWQADLDHAVLGPFFSKDGSGGYGETAFFHKATKTLLVTDMVVKVEDAVPPIVAEDPRCLLFHARDNALEKVENTEEVRLKGWRRIVQFALTFQPSSLVVTDLKQAFFEDAPQSKMKELGWGGLFPFEWKSPKEDLKSFAAMKGGLLVAPILQVLLLNRDPGPVLDWADRVAEWPFRRVIPCHLGNDIKTSPKEFRKAFGFLERGGGRDNSMAGGLRSLFGGGGAAAGKGGAEPLPEDLQFLRDAEKALVGLGTLFPAAEPIERR